MPSKTINSRVVYTHKFVVLYGNFCSFVVGEKMFLQSYQPEQKFDYSRREMLCLKLELDFRSRVNLALCKSYELDVIKYDVIINNTTRMSPREFYKKEN